MKTIESISIWDNGTTQTATILNAYAVNVSLGNSATFYYSLLSESMQLLAQGNLTMSGEDYSAWEVDNYAWDWIAGQLNLVITGDYVATVVEEVVEEVAPVEEEETTEE
jgi:hypothetical protein